MDQIYCGIVQKLYIENIAAKSFIIMFKTSRESVDGKKSENIFHRLNI